MLGHHDLNNAGREFSPWVILVRIIRKRAKILSDDTYTMERSNNGEAFLRFIQFW
jgi:hypothetical protein